MEATSPSLTFDELHLKIQDYSNSKKDDLGVLLMSMSDLLKSMQDGAPLLRQRGLLKMLASLPNDLDSTSDRLRAVADFSQLLVLFIRDTVFEMKNGVAASGGSVSNTSLAPPPKTIQPSSQDIQRPQSIPPLMRSSSVPPERSSSNSTSMSSINTQMAGSDWNSWDRPLVNNNNSSVNFNNNNTNMNAKFNNNNNNTSVNNNNTSVNFNKNNTNTIADFNNNNTSVKNNNNNNNPGRLMGFGPLPVPGRGGNGQTGSAAGKVVLDNRLKNRAQSTWTSHTQTNHQPRAQIGRDFVSQSSAATNKATTNDEEEDWFKDAPAPAFHNREEVHDKLMREARKTRQRENKRLFKMNPPTDIIDLRDKVIREVPSTILRPQPEVLPPLSDNTSMESMKMEVEESKSLRVTTCPWTGSRYTERAVDKFTAMWRDANGDASEDEKRRAERSKTVPTKRVSWKADFDDSTVASKSQEFVIALRSQINNC